MPQVVFPFVFDTELDAIVSKEDIEVINPEFSLMASIDHNKIKLHYTETDCIEVQSGDLDLSHLFDQNCVSLENVNNEVGLAIDAFQSSTVNKTLQDVILEIVSGDLFNNPNLVYKIENSDDLESMLRLHIEALQNLWKNGSIEVKEPLNFMVNSYLSSVEDIANDFNTTFNEINSGTNIITSNSHGKTLNFQPGDTIIFLINLNSEVTAKMSEIVNMLPSEWFNDKAFDNSKRRIALEIKCI